MVLLFFSSLSCLCSSPSSPSSTPSVVRKLLYRIEGGLDLSLTPSSHRSQGGKKEEEKIKRGSAGYPSLHGKARSISRAMIRIPSVARYTMGVTSNTSRRAHQSALSGTTYRLGLLRRSSRSAVAPPGGTSIPGHDAKHLLVRIGARALRTQCWFV